MARRIVAPGAQCPNPERAKSDGIAVPNAPRGIRPQEHGPYLNRYIGTAEDLIAAGVIQPHHLPAKCAVTFYKGVKQSRGCRVDWDEHYLKVQRKGRQFAVNVGVPRAERERRQARDRQAMQQQREAKAEQVLATFMAKPENLRASVLRLCRELAWTLASHTPGDHQRQAASWLCRFSPDGIEDVLDALSDVHEWIEAVTITPVADSEKRADAARRDKAFQAFLRAQCMGDGQ